MTYTELMKLYDNTKQELLNKQNEYYEFMNSYFPYYIHLPKRSEIDKLNLSEEQEDELYLLVFDDKDYSNILNTDLESLTYSKLYDYRRMPDKDIHLFHYFRRLINTYRKINYIIQHPEFNDTYIDTPVVHFDNDNIVITDPTYFDDSVKKYLIHETLCGDWACEIISNNKRLGTFTADGGYVGIMKLEDINVNLLNPCQYTIIYNFTGDVSIKVNYTQDIFFNFECYIEGNGNINFISKFISF